MEEYLKNLNVWIHQRIIMKPSVVYEAFAFIIMRKVTQWVGFKSFREAVNINFNKELHCPD